MRTGQLIDKAVVADPFAEVAVNPLIRAAVGEPDVAQLFKTESRLDQSGQFRISYINNNI